MRNHWEISVVDSLRIKGKPSGWMPSSAKLAAVGVPLGVARNWARVRREMTVGLRKRVKEDRN